MVKVTFTFDDQTVEILRRAASRLKKPQSVVVREAIQDYANRAERLSDEERKHLLKVVDRMMSRPAKRSQSDVDAEIREIRSSRRTGGRRTRAE
jgi:predicted DNA-binding protein